MTITSVSNSRYITADNSLIDMTVTDDRLGTFEFTYSPNDNAPTARQIFAFIEKGGLNIAPYVPPLLPVPQQITRRQFLLMLLSAQLITADEAMAAAKTGEVPAFVATFFDGLSPEQRTAAYITFASMGVIERNHPFITTLARIKKLTDAQVDDYFRQAATI